MGRAVNIILILAVTALIPLARPASGEIKAVYLYNLSDFSGTIPYSSPRISIDALRKEVYVISGDIIRVFNDTGMEIYSFGADLDVGILVDAAVDEGGNIYVLSYSYERKGPIITFCNFRGEPLSEVTVTNVPAEFQGFVPNRLVYRNGTIYLVSSSVMKVIMTDRKGAFKSGADLFSLMDIKPEKKSMRRGGKGKEAEEVKRENYGIAGFYVDHEGNMLFTSPVTALAYIVSPDLKVESFGKRGGAPGKFSVPRGIVRDRSGNYIVSDILKCVVMVFDRNFDFLIEFGYRGLMPGNLIGPTDMAIDDNSRLYVTQLMERGVSVFKLTSE
jgi:DNA-binding beta-propeller fold protein YncE